MSQNELKYTDFTRKQHGMTFRKTRKTISRGALGPHPDTYTFRQKDQWRHSQKCRLEITSESVYSLRVQFQGQFTDFLFPSIVRIRPEVDQTP